MSSTDVRLPQGFGRARGIAVIVGVVGLVAGALLGFLTAGPNGFFGAYLYAFSLVGGVAIGSVALLCIHHLTGGAWSFTIQRILEANTRTLPLVFVLGLPILIGLWVPIHGLYSQWMAPEGEFAHIIEKKALYLNEGFWTIRYFIYFAVWIGCAWLLNSWSHGLDRLRDDDHTNVPRLVRNLQRYSAPILIVYCLTMTFAALDWLMSLDPAWFSTIFAPLTWISQGLTILAFSTIIASYLVEERPLSQFVTVEQFHHLGNLIMAFVVLWSYMSFSQYLIIWAGNLPEEILYYVNRDTFGFNILAVFLMMFHFFVPLMLLLFRRNKKRIGHLRMICFYILGMRLVDMFWFVNPSVPLDGAIGFNAIHFVTYVLVAVGMAGIWFWFFVGSLSSHPLLPLRDPRLYEALKHEHAHPEMYEEEAKHHPEAYEHA